MTEFVRVKDNGTFLSVPATVAEADGLAVLDEPAADRNGNPLPPSTTAGSPDYPSARWSAPDLRDWAVAHGVIREEDDLVKADVLAAITKATKPTTEAPASPSGQEAQK